MPVRENEGGIKTDLSNLYTCKKWNFTSQGLPGEISPVKAGIKSTFEDDHFVGQTFGISFEQQGGPWRRLRRVQVMAL